MILGRMRVDGDTGIADIRVLRQVFGGMLTFMICHDNNFRKD